MRNRFWVPLVESAAADHDRERAPRFTAKELAWVLTHAPAETIVLHPASSAVAA